MQIDRPNKKISFKPLHDGVGFHPFSEGLPYAPQSLSNVKPESKLRPEHKTDYSRGTGAMSAGVPTFSMPKTTRQIQQQNSQNNIQKPIVNKQVSPSIQQTYSQAAPEQSVLRKRFFAYLLDTVVHLSFWISINLIATLGFHISLDNALVLENWPGFALFFIFSQWFFIAMQEVLFESTLGKSFFGLEFKRTRKSFFASSLFFRSMIFMVGILSLGIGLYFCPQDKIAEIQLKKS